MAIVWISKQELAALSTELRRAINGETVEFRDNQEGALSVLKNDLHTLVTQFSAERDAADAARAEFAEYMENITHQLKTPVTSMMLMADLLEAAPPERQEEFLANIRTSLARMNWLVDTLLKLAKLDAGAVQFERAAVTAQTLVEAALSPLAILLDVQDQQVALANDAVLHCDKRWTVEALTNLLKNACEASPFARRDGAAFRTLRRIAQSARRRHRPAAGAGDRPRTKRRHRRGRRRQRNRRDVYAEILQVTENVTAESPSCHFRVLG